MHEIKGVDRPGHDDFRSSAAWAAEA